MMKKVLSVIAVIMTLCMVLSLAACGGQTDEAALLKKFIESDEVQKQKESVQEALKDQMDVDFAAEDTTMVITYTLKQEFMDSLGTELTDTVKETIKSSMATYLDGQESTVEPMKESMKELGITEPSVRIEVLGPDGYDYGSKTY